MIDPGETAPGAVPVVVAHVCDDLMLGGWSSLASTLPELPRHGIRPLVVTLFGKGEYAEPLSAAGIPVHCLGLRRSNLAWKVLALARFFREHRVEVVHTHLPMSHLIGLSAARLAGIGAQVLHVHTADDAPGACSRWCLRRLVRRVSRVVAVSQSAAAVFAARHPDCHAPISVIANGIDVGALRARCRASVLRKADFAIPEDAFVLLMAANFKPEKGHRILLASAVRGLGDPPPHLVFAGDGAERAACEALARELGVADRCHFLGVRRDVPELLALADLLVLPSIAEQFGICLLEAFAAGVPVVASRVGGIPEVARDGIDALLVPPGDPVALAAAICELRSQPGPCEHRVANATERVAAFSHTAAAAHLAKLYRGLSLG
jgi:glycosyltransferase involved in cell wall biosynthesis